MANASSIGELTRLAARSPDALSDVCSATRGIRIGLAEGRKKNAAREMRGLQPAKSFVVEVDPRLRGSSGSTF